MKIIRAEHLGMCFGVRDAIALAENHSKAGPLTILGDLVHNEIVIDRLRSLGIRFQNHPAAVTTAKAMITAHGASDNARNQARALGLDVVEATCPLVHVAHRAVHALVRDGFHPVIIGIRDHVEVRGLTGDLLQFDVVLTEADVDQLAEHPRLGIASQTTQPADRVHDLVGLIRRRFPRSEVRFIDTVCQPTKQRQGAAVELARRCDAVVVIGGVHSNNTRELVATCSRHCRRVYHVQSRSDLQGSWFEIDDTVGITAGTSTPDSVVESVELALRSLTIPAIDKSPASTNPQSLENSTKETHEELARIL